MATRSTQIFTPNNMPRQLYLGKLRVLQCRFFFWIRNPHFVLDRGRLLATRNSNALSEQVICKCINKQVTTTASYYLTVSTRLRPDSTDVRQQITQRRDLLCRHSLSRDTPVMKAAYLPDCTSVLSLLGLASLIVHSRFSWLIFCRVVTVILLKYSFSRIYITLPVSSGMKLISRKYCQIPMSLHSLVDILASRNQFSSLYNIMFNKLLCDHYWPPHFFPSYEVNK